LGKIIKEDEIMKKLIFYCLLLVIVTLNANPKIMVTGYWNPTGQMIAPFSKDVALNPDGWIGENWENRGYDIYSYFPTPGSYEGDFEVDYQDTSNDFWAITDTLKPIAIISFGAGEGEWEIECNARNLTNWYNDYEIPYQPTPNPPDTTAQINFYRHSTLPVYDIANAVNNETTVDAWIDSLSNPGAFLCEFMAYHGMWYQDIHSSSEDEAPCLAAGFIHVDNSVALSECEAAAQHTIRTTIDFLESFVSVSGIVNCDSSPVNSIVNIYNDQKNYQTVVTQENGYFDIPLIPSGDYTLTCVKENQYFTIQEISVSSENTTFNIDLQTAEFLDEINYHDQQAGMYEIDFTHTLEAVIRFNKEVATTTILGEINFVSPSNPENVTITAIVYESSLTFNEPNILIYEKELDGFVEGELFTHYPERPIVIESSKNYWVGYKIRTTDGKVAYYDNGPIVQGHGAWIKDGGWFELDQRTGIDANWMIDCKLYDHFGVENTENIIPVNNKIQIRNYPNPFTLGKTGRSEGTTIAYYVPKSGYTEVSIYNIKGQKVKTLVADNVKSGTHEVIWNRGGKGVNASGVYFCRVKQGSSQSVAKLLLIK
jgi:hypothetical protein